VCIKRDFVEFGLRHPQRVEVSFVTAVITFKGNREYGYVDYCYVVVVSY